LKINSLSSNGKAPFTLALSDCDCDFDCDVAERNAVSMYLKVVPVLS